VAAIVVAKMTAPQQEAVHPEPVWRDRSNFVIGARLPEPGRTEQLWARQLGERRFEVCCIPFFLYDVALGDVVETDENYDFVRVVRPSGRYVFRVWFGDSTYSKDRVADGLTKLGALLEWSSANLLAVDAADDEQAKAVADFLQDHEDRQHLVYETGRLA